MAAKIKWFKTGSKGTGFLYYKKHQTRKKGVKFDRYHRAEYQYNGKRIAINFGWVSAGWTELKCLEKIAQLYSAWLFRTAWGKVRYLGILLKK